MCNAIDPRIVIPGFSEDAASAESIPIRLADLRRFS